MTATQTDGSADETTSLLGSRRLSQSEPVVKPFPHYRRTIFALVCFMFLLEIGDFLQRAPWLRLLESIICERYYDGQNSFFSGPVPEKLCKVDPVQEELATVNGIDTALSYLPSLLTTLPYGVLAERRGRKFVLCLSVVGIIMAVFWTQFIALLATRGRINYRWFLLNNAFAFIGGGAPVLSSTVFTMITDIAPAAQRSNAYFMAMSAAIIPAVISVPLAAIMMRTSVWRPMIIGQAIIVIGALIAFFLPETFPNRRAGSLSEVETSRAESDLRKPNRPPQKLSGWLRKKVESYAFLVSSPVLLALTPCFIIINVSPECMRLLVPMVSKRFEWEISRASFLLPVASISTLLLLLVILPFITTALIQRYHMPPDTANLIIARVSIILLIVGLVGIAVASNVYVIIVGIVLNSFGHGFSPAVRSIAAALAPADSMAKLFAACQLFGTIGGMISGPVLSKAYVLGLGWGGLWSGMPFLVTGGLYACVAVIIMLVRLHAREKDVAGAGRDAQDAREQDARAHEE